MHTPQSEVTCLRLLNAIRPVQSPGIRFENNIDLALRCKYTIPARNLTFLCLSSCFLSSDPLPLVVYSSVDHRHCLLSIYLASIDLLKSHNAAEDSRHRRWLGRS